MAVSTRRLQKELMDIKTQGAPVGIQLLSADDLQTWYLSLEILGETVYAGEKFALKFRFDNSYPISSPAVQFVVDDTHKAPIHPHVYSNGHAKELPPDNDRYVRHAPENPKKVALFSVLSNSLLTHDAW
ncbi:uncharacterized protein FIBRA_01986 [Fibroporia radiculosa]|uniref:UBC core domain-containing protein n=1 Tax=Fibroporia radiculosa TaxID=599839 RepID=J4I8T3_9APHY|nr:uncharacterized protein FIBRA_01986 [Fibroporia radiculosa]CCL99961.1 predicted protein [Fibroporia radiculosa]